MIIDLIMKQGFLNLPDNLRPVAIVLVGYPSKIPYPPQRVSRNEAVEVIENEDSC